MPRMIPRYRAVALVLLFAAALPGSAALGREVFHEERAEFADFPRTAKPDETVVLKARIRKGYRSPVLAVTKPDGETEYRRPDRTVEGWSEFDVIFGTGKGAYRFELVVDSSRGDTTAAQFTIWVGVPPPAEGEEGPARKSRDAFEPEKETTDTLVLERKLFRMINGYRKKRALEPFPWLEQAAYLAREHLRDYLKMKPRPKKLTHLVPGHGSIADRFEEFFAWPRTIRKFPLRDPEIGPEALGYCSESLAAVRSLRWLFEEYFLKESAFRAPIISEYPTHAAVGAVRDPKTKRILLATVFVQINSTRVREELEEAHEAALAAESKAREPARRAELLYRLARMGDPRSVRRFVRRLSAHRDPAVIAAAVDALLLNAPERAEKWAERRRNRIVRAVAREDFTGVIPAIRVFTLLRFEEEWRRFGEKQLRWVTMLSKAELASARRDLEAADTREARRALESVAEEYAGLPAADEAKKILDALPPRPRDR